MDRWWLTVLCAARSPREYADELPWRELPDHEWHSAMGSRGMATESSVLCGIAFARTNAIPQTPIQPRAPCTDTDWRPPGNRPCELFKEAIVVDKTRHGPFATRVYNKHRSDCLHRTYDTVTITNEQFWEVLLWWVELNVADFEQFRKGNRRHKLRAKLFVMPVDECMVAQATPYIWDLRDFWSKGGLIRPIRTGDERRHTLHADGIALLQAATAVDDLDIVDMMQTAVETHAYPQRAFMLCPSSKSFFEQAKEAATKAEQEEEEGVIERYPGPMFCPCRVYQEGYTVQRSGKLRRIGMGNSPSLVVLDGCCALRASPSGSTQRGTAPRPFAPNVSGDPSPTPAATFRCQRPNPTRPTMSSFRQFLFN